MDKAARDRAKNRTKRDNRKKIDDARNQLEPMAEDGTPLAKQPIGTPLGNRQRMQIFKNRLLKEENGSRILQKVLDVALDDDHPGQMTALKLCMDRMLPTSLFEDEKKSGDRPSIQINITGIGEKVSVEPIEGEVIDQSEL